MHSQIHRKLAAAGAIMITALFTALMKSDNPIPVPRTALHSYPAPQKQPAPFDLLSTDAERTVTLVNPHNGEWLDKVTYFHDGAYDKTALKTIDHFLRDWRNGSETPINPQSINIVYTIARNFYSDRSKPLPPIEIVSGFRTPSSQAALRAAGDIVARNSEHFSGDAIDFRLPVFAESGKLQEAKQFAESLHAGGVGYYPGGGNNFLHVDPFFPEPGHLRRWTVLPHKLISRLHHP